MQRAATPTEEESGGEPEKHGASRKAAGVKGLGHVENRPTAGGTQNTEVAAFLSQVILAVWCFTVFRHELERLASRSTVAGIMARVLAGLQESRV